MKKNAFFYDTLKFFWHFSSEEVLKKLQIDPNKGLTESEVRKRLKIYGKNRLKASHNHGTLRLLLSQFNSPLIYMLLLAAALSLILYDNTDALIIFAIIILSTFLSFLQERSAVKSMEKLLKIVQIKAAVIRDGNEKEVSVEDVVPGDLVVLRAGDVIPGDCYLLESKDLYVDEATLTGESFYSEKYPGVLPTDVSIAKRTNVLFMGTHVVSGSAKALVVFTGKNSEFGKISVRLETSSPETEFEHGIRRFSYFLLEVTFILLLVIFTFNIYLERPVVESLLFALSLSIGLTPQLLPAIITINLAHGAMRMAKNHVIVKKLASIENFGSMNILCADKTGTLTTGEIKLSEAYDCNGEKSDRVFSLAYLNAVFQKGYSNPLDKAILSYQSQDITGWEKLDEVPYDFVRKRLSILVKKENDHLMITKGAFQQVLDVCSYVESESGSIIDLEQAIGKLTQRFEEFSHKGFRVLGLAYRQGKDINCSLEAKHETGMIFLGFLLFFDPIKKDAAKVLADLEKLGIGLKIITGDNKLVAMYVARSFNIAEDKVLTGTEIHQMSDRALAHQVNKKSIFAEVEPNQKERIILALKKAGYVVGFLGDGINDVTALHAADVSITVDSAADAAKEVANIVLMKKDLSVLNEGVKAGRKTFANTLKYIFMASSANFGNMFSMAGASLFLSFLPLLPKQVLLTNLMTDFPEMTIATDHVDHEMLQKPLRWNISFIRNFMIIFGLLSSLFDYATFGMLLLLKTSVDEFRTGWFIESVVSATLIVLVIRTFRPFFTSLPSKYLLFTVLAVIILTLLLPFTPAAVLLGFTVIPNKIYLYIGLIVACYIISVEMAKKYFLSKI